MSPSVAPVRRSGRIARRNARSRAVVRTSSVSPPILSSLPGNTAAMVAELLRQAGWIINDKPTAAASHLSPNWPADDHDALGSSVDDARGDDGAPAPHSSRPLSSLML